MASHRVKIILTTIALLVGVASCGGGGGVQTAGGGIGGTGVSQGPITGFGSIFVNGVEFNTNSATIIKDGNTVSQNDLKIGMVVTVDGSIDSSTSGSATTVTYIKELEGPITAKTTNTLTVLGQTIIVDDLTKIVTASNSAAAIGDLAVNDIVEVSGSPSASGIRATYIGVKTSGAEYELKGVISALTNTTITIGNQLVDISVASYSFAPALGNYVEVKGSNFTGSTLIASTLELKTRGLGSNSKDKAELQGFVTSVSSATDFVLDQQPVHIDTQTNFNGGTSTDIKTGLRLEVEGALINGTLNATKIKFEDDLQLQGNIATLDTTAGVLTLDSYPGIDISFNSALTDEEDSTDLGALAVGDRIKARGRKLGGTCANTTCMLATQLKLESSGSSGGSSTGTTALLQGSVESVADPLITILGVTVDTSGISVFDGDGVTDKASFFNQVEVGSLVEVHGTRDGLGNVTWESIDLDD